MTELQKLKLVFWGTIAISLIPLAINVVEAGFGGSVKVETWLTSLIFVGFGYGISAIQNAFKIVSDVGDKKFRLYLLVSVILVFIIILPLAAVKSAQDPTILSVFHFIAIGVATLLLLRCAYVVDVIYSAHAKSGEG